MLVYSYWKVSLVRLHQSPVSRLFEPLPVPHDEDEGKIEGSFTARDNGRKKNTVMGHVKRMGDNRMPRIALEKEEGGRRPRGRWEDQVWKDIERRGLQKIQVDEEETWNDRLKWRRLCTTTRENGNV
ncbi:hypothetical protein J6590_022856 [Homalodisca vitripennis]|nr:hypothetical protein J6590_022856 [Homalodisca vitripennis]